MSRLSFLFGAFSMFLVALLAGMLALRGARGFSAREQPSAAERWITGWMRAAALPGDAKARTNPVPNTPEVLADARAHWADHCATCHANNGSGDTQMGKNLYPPAPDMRQSGTQQKTDGELFYIIQNGIRLTGMPAWGGSAHAEQDSWKLVHFIRHLPQLTFDEKKAMEKLNPKGPEDRQEEEEEEKFLRGEENHEPTTEHHHHH
ncbi:MAG TPA: c-type cytochrome [Bryobacteraceae bacterium]|jgi:mono/diheme cytochrome c family protein|nr:c-type cytochrome [Bryobacteraceae bacterium]